MCDIAEWITPHEQRKVGDIDKVKGYQHRTMPCVESYITVREFLINDKEQRQKQH